MIKYSAIIPFHSNANLLSACITSLAKALKPEESEIIIVDNNADGSQIPMDLNLPTNCRVILKKENLLYPRAVNTGVQSANGKYLIFCDADTYVTEDFYKGMVSILEKGKAGYVSAKLLNMQTDRILEYGITYSFYNFPHPFSGRNRNFELCNKDSFPLAACAACSMIEHKLYIDVGGFDEQLVHSYSDVDLCLRLAIRGYNTACSASSIAYHQGSSTSGSGMSGNLKEDTKGIFMSKHKHIPILITDYLDKACDYFMSLNKLSCKDYFVLDLSTIGNSLLYIRHVLNNLNIVPTGQYRHPYKQRDAEHIDLINFVTYIIRNYKVPILYFVDNFQALGGNALWKSCRCDYADLVVDRNANIELLCNI